MVALEGGDGFVVAAEAVQRAADVDLQARVGDAGEGLLEGNQGSGVVGGLGELAAAAAHASTGCRPGTRVNAAPEPGWRRG